MSEGKSISETLIERLLDIPDWMVDGACFTEDVSPIDEDDMAKMLDLCQSCPLIEKCNENFSDIHENVREIKSGVFGGVSYFPRSGG